MSNFLALNKVLDANPVLESFGNAKTVLNDNSSRFGKFTKMLFSERKGSDTKDRSLIGAVVETYLLEKSRVCKQDKGERNYHVFYYICSQASKNPEWRLGSGNPEKFHYLNQSGCTTQSGDSQSDVRDFEQLTKALGEINMDKETQNRLFGIVAGILHLGNVVFLKKGEESTIKEKKPVDDAAALLGVPMKNLSDRLLTRTISVDGKGAHLLQCSLSVQIYLIPFSFQSDCQALERGRRRSKPRCNGQRLVQWPISLGCCPSKPY